MPSASTAARWASWDRAGRQTLRSSGQQSRGQPFMTNQFGPNSRIIVEAAIGADLTADETTWNWIDLSSVVYFPTAISISQGRSDNTSTAQPGTCSLTFRNEAGDLTPYNPASVYFPYVRRGTPLRVSIDLGVGLGPTVIYQGAIASLTPTWDISGKVPLVAVVAGGATRRLAQGKTPFRSALYRASLTLPGLFAYWPMEDGPGATSFASAVGGKPLVSTSANRAGFAQAGPVGSLPLPQLAALADTGGCVYAASVRQPVNVTAFCVSVVARINDFSKINSLVVFTTSGGYRGQLLYFPVSLFGGLAGVFLALTTESGQNNTALEDGDFHLLQCTLAQNGPNVDCGVFVDGVGGFVPGAFPAVTLGSVQTISVGNDTTEAFGRGLNITAGHVSVCSVSDPANAPSSTHLAAAVAGHTGESPVDRLARVCGEEDIAFSAVGTSDITMGPQPFATVMDVLREPETADVGFLFDGFSSGLRYRSRSSWYNLAAAVRIDASAGQLVPPFGPVDDDQRLRNDATASRSGGSPVRVVDTSGDPNTDPTQVGTFDTSVTVNVDSDDQLDDIAGWIVRLGTVPGLRYPSFALDFAATPELASLWINAGPPGFRVDITNVSSTLTQHPPDTVSVIAEGWSMTLDPINWNATVNCSPFSPFVVPVLDDPVLGKLGTNSTTLDVAGWDGVAGTFKITTATGPLWSTNAADYPVDLNLAGQRVTVSGCSGASNPQTLTVSVAAVNGISKNHPPGEVVKLWYRLRPAL